LGCLFLVNSGQKSKEVWRRLKAEGLALSSGERWMMPDPFTLIIFFVIIGFFKKNFIAGRKGVLKGKKQQKKRALFLVVATLGVSLILFSGLGRQGQLAGNDLISSPSFNTRSIFSASGLLPFRPSSSARQRAEELTSSLSPWPALWAATESLSQAGLSEPFSQDSEVEEFPVPKIPFAPPNYVCYRSSSPLKVDGALDERDWRRARWTEDFVDIEGENRPKPRFRTRVKMLWDDTYFYVGAELEEKDVWATLTERDSIIYQDNDFEVFIDPDDDTHEYYELEINALGTVWDLLLLRPYRDGGPAVHAWDIRGLKAAVKIEGTINRPGDRDKGWTVELAFPWEVLKECLGSKKLKPDSGDQWRVNFSRVEYRLNVREGKYEKAKDPASGQPLAEDNWVWAPTGLVNIHYPEMWGYVQFSDKIVGEGREDFRLSLEQDASWALRQVYYRQRDFYSRHGRYSDNLGELGLDRLRVEGYQWPPRIMVTWNLWEARLDSQDGKTSLFIRQDGRLTRQNLD